LAPLVHSRASELGHALAAEGMTLGRFELGQNSQQTDNSRRDNNPPTPFEREPMDRLTNNRAPVGGASRADDSDGPRGRTSRIHVKA
jgi:hypothetical protein